jgi:hypothetical protein
MATNKKKKVAATGAASPQTNEISAPGPVEAMSEMMVKKPTHLAAPK